MKNGIALILFLVATKNIFAQDPDIRQLRTYYYNASQKSSDAEAFYNLLRNAQETQPLLLGYKGMAEFMKCYHSFNPLNKLNYFYKGKSNLDKAIALSPADVELRYLRFTVQTNVPSLLNYRDHIEDDKKFLIENFRNIQGDHELHQMIREYMIKSDYCSKEEKEFFQKS